jgi:LacI family repressor for deo operon, udp, cdd, tsx, nupC, and nupG
MKKNKKKVIIKDVATLAGVSVGSVSNYINSHGNLKSTTKNKIEAAINKLEYEPDFLARSMRTGKTDSIAVIVPDILNPFFAEIYNSIKVSAIKQGLLPILYTADDDVSILKKYLISQSMRHSNGIILCFVDDDEAIAEIIQKTQHIPTVMVSWHIENQKYSTVSIDVFEGTAKATEHLISLGHRIIGYIGGQDRISKEKQRGFERAVLDSKLDLLPHLEYHGDFSLQTGFMAAKKFMKLKEKPTAVFAENDILAIGFIKYCLQNKIKVPGDVSVIGFDNIKLSEMYEPSLSTVALPIKEIGECAVKLLLEEAHGNGIRNSIVLGNELITRSSTGKNIT